MSLAHEWKSNRKKKKKSPLIARLRSPAFLLATWRSWERGAGLLVLLGVRQMPHLSITLNYAQCRRGGLLRENHEATRKGQWMLVGQVTMNVHLNKEIKRESKTLQVQKSRSVVFKECSRLNFSTPIYLLCVVSPIPSSRNIFLLNMNSHLRVHLKCTFSWCKYVFYTLLAKCQVMNT